MYGVVCPAMQCMSRPITPVPRRSSLVPLVVITQLQIGDRSICIACVCVCVCVCLSVRDIISSGLHVRSLPFLCMLPMTVARSSSGNVMIRYVFPVLWMTSYLHISWGCSTPGDAVRLTRSLGMERRNARCRQRTPGTTSWRVLKVTPQVVTPGAKFAVCDCLVLIYFWNVLCEQINLNTVLKTESIG